MPRRAERRTAQAAAEWISILVAVGAVLTGAALWHGGALPSRIAHALAPQPVPEAIGDVELDAAIAGRPGALSALGAAAWLADDSGAAEAQTRLVERVAVVMHRDHPGWGAPIVVAGPPIRARRSSATVTSIGPYAARVVGFSEERALGHGPTVADRAGAGAASLGWAGAGSIARRVARPLGLAVGAAQLAVGLIDSGPVLPAGTRAGDIIVCRRATATIRDARRPGRIIHRTVWRIGVLRDGRVILDAVAADDRCRAPADR